MTDNKEPKVLYGNIKVIKPNGKPGGIFPLKRRFCTFGTGDFCDISVNIEGIKEKHARIDVQPLTNSFYITNLADDGGVLVNDKPIPSKHKAHVENKDEIVLQGRKFVVEIFGVLSIFIPSSIRLIIVYKK